jgi:NAD(P)H dehydrogenase (quinone)
MLEKFLVYGSNGAQGGAMVRALLAQDKRVRVLARDTAQSAFRRDRRVEVVAGDLDDPKSLRDASEGVSGIYLMMPLSFDHPRVSSWGRNAIDAASQSSASLLVFNASGLVPDAPVGIPALDQKLELLRYLRDARIPNITLSGTLYMGNLGAPWSASSIVHQGVLAYPLPEALRVSWLSWEEAAAYAVAAFTRPDLGARKAVLQLGGAEALTGGQLARSLSRALDKPIRYFQLPLPQLEASLSQMFGARAGAELAEYYGWLSQPRERSLLDVDITTARTELPVPQRRFDEWSRDFPWTMLAGGNR